MLQRPQRNQLPAAGSRQQNQDNAPPRQQHLTPVVEESDWSDSSNEVDSAGENSDVVGLSNVNGRLHERSRPTPRTHRTRQQPSVPRTPLYIYNHDAGGQAVPYRTFTPNENPFIPQNQPFAPNNPVSPTPVQHHPQMHPQIPAPIVTPQYPAVNYGASPYYADNPFGTHQGYFPQQGYGYHMQGAPDNQHAYYGSPAIHTPGYDFNYGPQPYATHSTPRAYVNNQAPSPHYVATTPRTGISPPSNNASESVRGELNAMRRDLQAVKIDQRGSRMEERLRSTEARNAELEAQQKRKDSEKLKRRYERKIKVEVEAAVQRERGQRSDQTMTDSMSKPSAKRDSTLLPAHAKKMEDAKEHQDKTRDTEPDNALNAAILNTKKLQSKGRSRENRSDLSRASSQRSMQSSLSALRADPDLQSDVKKILLAMSIRESIRLEDEEDSSHVSSRQLSRIQDSNGGTGQQHNSPGRGQLQISIDPLANTRGTVTERDAIPDGPHMSSVNMHRPRHTLQRQAEYSHNDPRSTHRDSDLYQAASPVVVDSGYTSPMLDGVKSPFSRPRSNVQAKVSTCHSDVAEDRKVLERQPPPYSRTKSRRIPHAQAFLGILSSDDELQDDQTRRTARTSTPYALSRGHRNEAESRIPPRAPDVPTDRS